MNSTICDDNDNESYFRNNWAEVDPDDMSLLEEQTIEFMKNLNNKKENHD